MEQLNIISKPKSFNENGEKVEDFYLTPCMLRQETPVEVFSPEHDPRLVSTPILCWVFTDNFLPPPIFHRLLAACVSRWPVTKNKETSEYLIFCGCCVFDLGLFHRLTLHFKNHVVFARITKMVIDDVKTPDAKVCSRVRKFIGLNLFKITSYLGQNLQYDLRLECPISQIKADDGRFCCLPFHMWFADEGHDPDAPIMPQHMNHARLCVAVVSVCGSALREILLTHVPPSYTDIYKAILASKDHLINKRQARSGKWLNALLSYEQSQVVFQGPYGRNIADVNQFDISLLYILIRNVSNVAPPAMVGWGNDPPDQPRDRSLGASVERIRLYRNEIVGHSMDGMVSRQKFDKYWNKVDTVLQDVEDAIHRKVFREQLERHKRQVISIYEAC
ncbi:hypothetical protein CHS0354_010726 [Potamilus streckersoni]|uniref:DZIP3-like HEPN domain-containing protein n=1 Tax=Potamilus streckersoni TaxID=2493646 RepID=A0AAE0SVJ3_9BIVA|nr:hypothetical protein CHS0354_010726 [Potamilus streckersoni]